MKSITILDLIDIDNIDYIYVDNSLFDKIELPKTNFVLRLNEIKDNYNKINAVLLDFKNINKIENLDNKISNLIILNTPFLFYLSKKLKDKFNYKYYYVLPNINNPEIFIMKKDVKFLQRFWSFSDYNFFKNIYLMFTFLSLKYKFCLFLLPKIYILYEK